MKNEKGEMLFEKTVCNVPHKIRTQTVEKAVNDWEEVLDLVTDIFEDEDEFVTLTVGDARHNIRYVQARRHGNGIIVQLGIEDDKYTRLVEKFCNEEECVDIFREFYLSANVKGSDRYQPVKF